MKRNMGIRMAALMLAAVMCAGICAGCSRGSSRSGRRDRDDREDREEEEDREDRGAGQAMPFNGDADFYDISFTIPMDFIRDSTQSSDTLWVFERDSYSSYILVSYTAGMTDTAPYGEYVTSNGGEVTETTLGDLDALDLTYVQDDKDCREIVFIYNDAMYAVALRGGSEDEFEDLRDSIVLAQE